MEHTLIDVEIRVNTFDADGNVLRDKKTVMISAEQLDDIVSHAIQLTILNGSDFNDAEKEGVVEELGEAIYASGLMDECFIEPAI